MAYLFDIFGKCVDGISNKTSVFFISSVLQSSYNHNADSLRIPFVESRAKPQISKPAGFGAVGFFTGEPPEIAVDLGFLAAEAEAIADDVIRFQ